MGALRGAAGMVAVAGVLALTGCASEEDGDPTAGATTTAASGQATSEATSDEDANSDSDADSDSDEPDPSDPRAEGSGCDPGSGALSDGRWFGTLEDATADELDFDLACWFIGEDATLAAAEDGAESPPANDYYVRDLSSQVRTVPVDPAATAVFYPSGSPASEEDGSVADLIAAAEARDGYPYGVWLELSGGVVVSIQEQWVP